MGLLNFRSSPTSFSCPTLVGREGEFKRAGLAGSASTNPVLFTLAIGLMLAWKVAGYYGVDRYLLPRLGTPWRPGTIMRREAGPAPG